jgi:hypothetical protein
VNLLIGHRHRCEIGKHFPPNGKSWIVTRRSTEDHRRRYAKVFASVLCVCVCVCVRVQELGELDEWFMRDIMAASSNDELRQTADDYRQRRGEIESRYLEGRKLFTDALSRTVAKVEMRKADAGWTEVATGFLRAFFVLFLFTVLTKTCIVQSNC